MKVLVILDNFDSKLYTFLYNEIIELSKRENDLEVICENLGENEQFYAKYRVLPRADNWLTRFLFFKSFQFGLFYILRLTRYYKKRQSIIKVFNPDIVHVHFGDTAIKNILPIFDVLKKYKVVVSFHGFDASKLLLSASYRRNLEELKKLPNVKFIHVSKQLELNLKKFQFYPLANSFLLHYGIQLEYFKRTNFEKGSKVVFLQISTFFEKKGHAYTLKAFKLFIENYQLPVTLILGGTGPEYEKIKQLAFELNLLDNVVFPGWISRQKALYLLNVADVFVHPSITAVDGDQEGLPNAIIEAMAMELPILSTVHSGIPEIVEDGVNGILVPEKQIELLAEAMHRIYSWQYLSRNRQKVLDGFSIEGHTQHLLEIYNS